MPDRMPGRDRDGHPAAGPHPHCNIVRAWAGEQRRFHLAIMFEPAERADTDATPGVVFHAAAGPDEAAIAAVQAQALPYLAKR